MSNLQELKISLKKADQVEVIAGRDKGKTGKILKVDAKTGRITVEKVNMVKRHMKATQKSGSGIVEKEIPIHCSNVALFCPKCNRGVRHGHKFVEKTGKKDSGKLKIRVCKRCGESLDLA